MVRGFSVGAVFLDELDVVVVLARAGFLDMVAWQDSSPDVVFFVKTVDNLPFCLLLRSPFFGIIETR